MTDRPATETECEIEVTPEMIEAGLEAFSAFDGRWDEEEDAVANIYRAMVRRADSSP